MSIKRLSDYRVLKDGPIVLNAGDGKSLGFNPPNDTILGTNSQNPVLSFRVEAGPGQGGELRATVEDNGNEVTVIERDIPGGEIIEIKEIVDGSAFHVGDNSVKFYNDGGGQFKVSDVVVWYKRAIDVGVF